MMITIRRWLSKLTFILAVPIGIIIPYEYVKWATPSFNQMIAEAWANGMLLNASSPSSCAFGMAILITIGMFILGCCIYPGDGEKIEEVPA